MLFCLPSVRELPRQAVQRQSEGFKEMEIPYVTRFTPSWIIYMNKATLWITNSRLPLWIPKPKDTTYLQTWHGTPLKRLGTDIDTVHMPGTETEKYKRNFTKESSKWDYLISPNRYSTEIFRRAFAYDRPVLETGYPRNDAEGQEDHFLCADVAG